MTEQHEKPAWRRETRGEALWPFVAAVTVMIGLQFLLPERLSAGPRWALPALEVLIVAVLIAANPRRVERGMFGLRRFGLGLVVVASLGNAWSVIRLVLDIALGEDVGTATHLLAAGGAVYLINVLTFAIWYWEFDRGGPLERAVGTQQSQDLLFPQMTSGDLAPADWEPQFVDYLYFAFTNSTAFSPTDVLPMTRWVKVVMMCQATLSVVIGALVVAKAVNVL